MKRFLLLAALFVLAGCGSPEAERARGGGPGADKGNRGEYVRMHEGSKPYHDTPRANPVQGPPLDGAHHAYTGSRR